MNTAFKREEVKPLFDLLPPIELDIKEAFSPSISEIVEYFYVQLMKCVPVLNLANSRKLYWIFTSPEIASIFAGSSVFIPSNAGIGVGIHWLGRINSFNIYVDPLMKVDCLLLGIEGEESPYHGPVFKMLVKGITTGA